MGKKSTPVKTKKLIFLVLSLLAHITVQLILIYVQGIASEFYFWLPILFSGLYLTALYNYVYTIRDDMFLIVYFVSTVLCFISMILLLLIELQWNYFKPLLPKSIPWNPMLEGILSFIISVFVFIVIVGIIGLINKKIFNKKLLKYIAGYALFILIIVVSYL